MPMAMPNTNPAAPSAPHPESGIIRVTHADLPLCCPRPADTLWNMHPRVFLPIEDEPNREAVCPYCGAHYRLED
ncbi:zinc-finger domain-containing protein [Thioalkalicoccus limnaeus]|uniref:zinc-finger domain-containing protein n=1 Tax=Thioalkalicoccus limnaeus TaxID=120681 RepID=UPI003F74789D